MKNFKFPALFIMLLLFIAAAPLQEKLRKTALFNKQLEIMIPIGFVTMSEEMAKIKYPSENRPPIIYTNDAGTVNLAFNHTPSKATQQQIEMVRDEFKKMFSSIYGPQIQWKSDGIKTINGKKIGYIEMFTPAEDTNIYNLMFFTDLNDRLLLCTFNCTEAEAKEWQPVAHRIFNSIKIK